MQKFRQGLELWGLQLRSNNGGTVTDSNKLGIFQHANTVDRTYTLPDATGTLALNNQTMYIGTTAVAINRASAALALSGVSFGGTASQFVKADGTLDSNAYAITTHTHSTITNSLTLGAASSHTFLKILGDIATNKAPVFSLFRTGNAEATLSLTGGVLKLSTTGGLADYTDTTLQAANGMTLNTSGAAVFTSSVTASSLVKSGGTSSQFLKADGSVDSNTYALSSAIPTVNAGTLSASAATAGATNTTVAINFSAAWNANSASNVTINPVIGPAITALASTMTGATTGFLKKTAADTYTLDTSIYALNNQTMYIGTTAVAINRASAALTLAGVSLSTLTIGNGLSGTSYNGSSAITIAVNAANNTTSANYYPVFATSQGTSVALGTNSGFIFNPFTGALTATSFIKSGGTSGQFLKADGSADSTAYVIATQLSSYSIEAYGAGLVGFDPGNLYSPDTVGSFLRSPIIPESLIVNKRAVFGGFTYSPATGTTVTIDCSIGNTFIINLPNTSSANVVFGTPSTPATYQVINIIFIQGATYFSTISWPASTIMKWGDGTKNINVTTAGAISMLSMIYTGSYWLVTSVKNFS